MRTLKEFYVIISLSQWASLTGLPQHTTLGRAKAKKTHKVEKALLAHGIKLCCSCDRPRANYSFVKNELWEMI
jgi:hypothetical protein